MTYRPRDELYGPPLHQWLPAVLYAVVALAVALLVFFVGRGPRDTELYRYMFMQRHLIDAQVVSIIMGVSAVAMIFRTGMRGVRIRSDAVEYRDVVSNVWPKVKKFRWAQIDGINVEPSGNISLDMWDGTRQFLPRVGDPEALTTALERVAMARAIPMRGGHGLDDFPESADFPEVGA